MQDPNPLLTQQIDFLSKAARSNGIDADINSYLKKGKGNHTQALQLMLRDNNMEIGTEQEEFVHKEFGLKVVSPKYFQDNRITDEEAESLKKERDQIYTSLNDGGIRKGVGLGGKDYDARSIEGLVEKKKAEGIARMSEIKNRLELNDELEFIMPDVKKLENTKLGMKSLDQAKREMAKAEIADPYTSKDNPFNLGESDLRKEEKDELQNDLDEVRRKPLKLITAQTAFSAAKALGGDRKESDVKGAGYLYENLAFTKMKLDMYVEDYKKSGSPEDLEKAKEAFEYVTEQSKEIAKADSLGEALKAYGIAKTEMIDADAEVNGQTQGFLKGAGRVAVYAWKQTAYSFDDIINKNKSYEDYLADKETRGKAAIDAQLPAAFRGSPIDRYVDVGGQKFLVDQHGDIETAVDDKFVPVKFNDSLQAKADIYENDRDSYPVNSGVFGGHINWRKVLGSNTTVALNMIPVITGTAAMQLIPGLGQATAAARIIRFLGGVGNSSLMMFHQNFEEQLKTGKGYKYAWETAGMTTLTQSLIEQGVGAERMIGTALGKGIAKRLRADLDGFVKKGLAPVPFYKSALKKSGEYALELGGENIEEEGQAQTDVFFNHLRNGIDTELDPARYGNTALSMPFGIGALKAVTSIFTPSDKKLYQDSYIRALFEPEGATEVIDAFVEAGGSEKEGNIKKSVLNGSKEDFDGVRFDTELTNRHKNELTGMIAERDRYRMMSENIVVGPSKDKYAEKAKEIDKAFREKWTVYNKQGEEAGIENDAPFVDINNEDENGNIQASGDQEAAPDGTGQPAAATNAGTPQGQPGTPVTNTPGNQPTPVPKAVPPGESVSVLDPAATVKRSGGTLFDVLDNPDTVYEDAEGNQGTIVVDEGGKTEFRTKDTVVELGNIDDIFEKNVSELGLSAVEGTKAVDSHTYQIGDGTYQVRYSKPEEAISEENGEIVVEVERRTAIGGYNGKETEFKFEKVKLRGAQAEEIAYQIHLEKIDNSNENRARFEVYINTPEVKSEIDAGSVQAATQETAAENTPEVQPAEVKQTPAKPKRKTAKEKRRDAEAIEEQKKLRKERLKPVLRSAVSVVVGGVARKVDMIIPNLPGVTYDDVIEMRDNAEISNLTALAILQRNSKKGFTNFELNNLAAEELAADDKRRKAEKVIPFVDRIRAQLSKAAGSIEEYVAQKVLAGGVKINARDFKHVQVQKASLQSKRNSREWTELMRQGYVSANNKGQSVDDFVLTMEGDPNKAFVFKDEIEAREKVLMAFLALSGKNKRMIVEDMEHEAEIPGLAEYESRAAPPPSGIVEDDDVPFMEREEKVLTLQQIKDYVKRIFAGTKIYKRFSPDEQSGLAKGGRIHAEASLILGGENSTNSTSNASREEQEERIEAYAKAEGVWVGDTKKYLTEKYGKPLWDGGEATVWQKDENTVIKSQNIVRYGNLQEKLDGITLQNANFPEAAVKVVGFGRTGFFQVIIEQPFIKAHPTEKIDKKQINDYFYKLGYKYIDNYSPYYTSTTIAEDVHIGNAILTPEGNIVVIDPIMRLNTSDRGGVGGKKGERVVKGFSESERAPTEIDIDRFNDLLDNLNESIQGVLGGVLDGQEFTDKVKEKTGRVIRSARRVIYGFVDKDGKVWLNGDRINANTPVHEYSHIWTSVVESIRPDIIAKGLEIIEKTKYVEQLLAMGDDSVYAPQIRAYKKGDKTGLQKEALAMAIGDRGEQIVNQANKNRFKAWLKDFWNSVKEFFGGKLTDLTPEQIQKLTPLEFIELAAGQLVGGGKVVENPLTLQDGKETVLKRLRPEEEQGRIRSGEINVEATVLAEAVHRAIQSQPWYSDSQKVIAEEERFLEDYARNKGVWVENLDKKFGKEPDQFGQEQKVYHKNDTTLTKLNSGVMHMNWLEYFDRLAVHATLFPSTKYILTGFGKDSDGKFHAIVEQEIIIGKRTTLEKIAAYMAGRGFIHEDDGYGQINKENYRNKEIGVLVEDLHLGNVLEDDNGNLFVIDPIIYIDTPDRGGARVIGESDTQFQAKQDGNRYQVIQLPNGKTIKVFHGTNNEALDRNNDGLIWFTDSQKVADQYRKRSVFSNEVDYEGYDDSKTIIESQSSIQTIAEEQGIDLTKGKVFEGQLAANNLLDLTDLGTNVDKVSVVWGDMFKLGLVDEAWKDLDEDVQQELKEDYRDKALWKFLEEEGIYDAAEKKGYDGVIIHDVGIDGIDHLAYGLFGLNPDVIKSAQFQERKEKTTKQLNQERLDRAKAEFKGALADIRTLGSAADPWKNLDQNQRFIGSLFKLAIAKGITLKDDILDLIRKEVDGISNYKAHKIARTLQAWVDSYNKPGLDKKLTALMADMGLDADGAIDFLERAYKEPETDKPAILKHLEDLRRRKAEDDSFFREIEGTKKEFLVKFDGLLRSYKEHAAKFHEVNMTGHYEGAENTVLVPDINGVVVHATQFIAKHHSDWKNNYDGSTTAFVEVIAKYLNETASSGAAKDETISSGTLGFIGELIANKHPNVGSKYFESLIDVIKASAAERRSGLSRGFILGKKERNPLFKERIEMIDEFKRDSDEDLSEEDSEAEWDEDGNEIRQSNLKDMANFLRGEAQPTRKVQKMDGNISKKAKKIQTELTPDVVSALREKIKKCR